MHRSPLLAVACSLALGCLACANDALAAAPVVLSSSANGSSLTINGSNLSGGAATVTVGSSAALAITAQTATQLVATLPPGLAAGDYSLYVQIGTHSNNTSSLVTLGAVGPTGPAGAQGLPGPQGATGAAGATGAQGLVGPTGTAGAQGPAGTTGATGAQGQPGPTGAMGVRGATGSTGASGSTGATGAQGDAGPQGPMGPAGGPALQIIDANGGVVGSVYGGPTSGSGYVLVPINSDRIAVQFNFGDLDVNGQIQGPELTLTSTGYLAYPLPGCGGTPYIMNSWVAGATKPSVVYNYGPQFVVYMPMFHPSAQLISIASVLYPGRPDGAHSSPSCLASSGQGYGYVADSGPMYMSWAYPFSVQ